MGDLAGQGLLAGAGEVDRIDGLLDVGKACTGDNGKRTGLHPRAHATRDALGDENPQVNARLGERPGGVHDRGAADRNLQCRSRRGDGDARRTVQARKRPLHRVTCGTARRTGG